MGRARVRCASRADAFLRRVRSSLIVPWSEPNRYSGGHHGASPQEMVLPLAVLTRARARWEDFREVGNVYPGWWFEPSAISAAPPRSARSDTIQAYEAGAADARVALARQPTTVAPSWLDRLFESPVLRAQKSLSEGRGFLLFRGQVWRSPTALRIAEDA